MILETVLATIERHAMLRAGDRVLVAVSGGPDSVALLRILLELREALPLEITVAHLDHSLRGADSDDDRRFVEALARSLELPCVCRSRDVAALAKREKRSLEEAGRLARRRFLRDEAAGIGASAIALGHHRNDQAETVLLRLIEGTGRGGLSGIKPVSEGLFVRPLIDCSKAEILSYLGERAIAFRTDRSNDDLRFPRNLVRHRILPLLEGELNPRVAEAIARTADTLREEDEYLDRLARRALRRMLIEPGASLPKAGVEQGEREGAGAGPNSGTGSEAIQGVTLDAAELCCLSDPIGRRVLRLALRRAGLRGRDLSKARIDELLALAGRQGSNATLSLAERLTARLEYGRLILGAVPGGPPVAVRSTEAGATTLLTVPGEVAFEELEVSIRASLAPIAAVASEYRTAGPDRAYLDADLLAPPLVVRTPAPGDRLHPLGGPGSRKLSDLWTDLKLPAEARRKLLVVESAGRIAWVAGVRIADPFRVTGTTQRVARLEMVPLGAPSSLAVPTGSPEPSPASPCSEALVGSTFSGPGTAGGPGAGGGPGPGPTKAVHGARPVLYSPEQIAAAVGRLADEIAGWARGRELLVLAVLHGSFIFAADLVRRLPMPVRIGFVDREGAPISRNLPIEGALILLVEDILDTGESLDRILRRAAGWNAAEIRTCVLFDKQLEMRKVPLTADFAGLTVPDRWVVGYGLDNEGRERNLPFLTYIDP